jgi:hypothetical protein
MTFSRPKPKTVGVDIPLVPVKKTSGSFWYSLGTVMILLAMLAMLTFAVWIILVMNNMKVV